MQFDFFSKTEMSLSDKIMIEDIFEAYFACRKTKRRTVNALSFELNFEKELIKLLNDINNNTYKIGRSIAFMVNYPVKREIFAADFRDRVVHHLVISKINDLLEQDFVDNSFSCRKGKGVLYGVKKIKSYIEDCVAEFGQDCYILKLDIKSFFMSIDKNILYLMLFSFLNEKYQSRDKTIMLRLFKQIIFNRPEHNCIIKGKKSDWNDLPKHKSLFYSDTFKGLPIGNLTSQVFANVYLNKLDKYIIDVLGFKYYGRYVDDFVLIHHSKEYLLEAHRKIKVFLTKHLKLELHPNKFYLQHYSKGVSFIGAIIKKDCVYIGKRSKGNLYNKIYKQINALENNSKDKEVANFQSFTSCVNSYFGIMRHYDTYRLRSHILRLLDNTFFGNIMELVPNAKKFCIKKIFSIFKQKKVRLSKQKKYRKYQLRKTRKGK